MSEEEEWAKLPLPEQFAHKNWKARKGGYEAATKEFKVAQPTAPVVREFIFESALWKGAVGDSNVAAQQEGLNAYNAFLDAAGTEGARKTRSSTIAPAVEKGLIGRPAAKAAALETLLLLIELDKPDPVIEELLPFLSHKLPKIIAATLSALTAIYHAYGCKTVEPKPVVKLLPKVFGHADKNVRAEAQGLTVELYRWLRDAMKPLFWGELKEVQQKDLEKLFEPVKAEPSPKQERLLRSQQAIQEQAAAAGTGDAEGEDYEEDGGEIDLEPEFEAVDVFAKVPKDFSERLASSKWKDRKEALDDLFAAVNVPSIQEGPFDDIMRGCAKSMKDANIMVVTIAANCVEAIAKGLRKPFSKYRSTVLAPMLERFKEKKQGVTDALAAACDAAFMSTGLGDIQADVLEALKNKNPQIKEHSAKFMIRSLKTTREAPTLEQTKEFAEGAKKLLTESSAPLRDAGAETIGVLWKIMGDRNMLAHLEGLDDIRKTKIKEFSDAAEVRAKWKPKAAPPPRAPAGPAAAGRKPALGAKKPAAGAGVKKSAPPPRAASPPLVEEVSPLKARPTARPQTKAPGAGGLRPPGGGLKPPGTGLQKPGAVGLKAPSQPTTNTGSPKRQGMVFDEAPQIPSTPKASSAGPGRGLAARPIGAKPSAVPASPPPTQSSRSPTPASSALSNIERQELADLRAEIELVRQQGGDLRNDKSRLASQVAELQVQNAQLIEDHTRDVLQIKAKETQLVRARSDAEAAEERANSMSKEVERLKREISRLGRAAVVQGLGGRDSPVDFGIGMNGNGIANGNGIGNGNGMAGEFAGNRHSRSYHVPSARSYGNIEGFGGEGSTMQQQHTQPLYSRPMSNGSSGRATPASVGDASDSGERNGKSGGEGVESWRRAAEVTQNLKARIEMMKARQNLGRGQ